ncbi:hypothetical protein MKX03_012074 [Papaver bracteatum]|nr:hypothetical protein MKX03_012074 [Papaver bracteatum]
MLYITPNSIVYKVVKPVAFPCFGVLKKEKHILLPLIADIVIEQGYLQSYFGVYSIRIENVGVRRSSSDDVHIHGVANPREFRKVVLTHLANLKRESVLTSHGLVLSPSRLQHHHHHLFGNISPPTTHPTIPPPPMPPMLA